MFHNVSTTGYLASAQLFLLEEVKFLCGSTEQAFNEINDLSVNIQGFLQADCKFLRFMHSSKTCQVFSATIHTSEQV